MRGSTSARSSPPPSWPGRPAPVPGRAAGPTYAPRAPDRSIGTQPPVGRVRNGPAQASPGSVPTRTSSQARPSWTVRAQRQRHNAVGGAWSDSAGQGLLDQ